MELYVFKISLHVPADVCISALLTPQPYLYPLHPLPPSYSRFFARLPLLSSPLLSSLLLPHPLLFSPLLSSSVRVSNELGAGQPFAARHAAYVAVALALLSSALLALLVLSVRDHLVWLFAGSQASAQLTERVHELLPYLIVCLPGMCVPTVLQGEKISCHRVCLCVWSAPSWNLQLPLDLTSLPHACAL